MRELFGEISGEGIDGVSGNVGIGGKKHAHAGGYGGVVGDGVKEGGELIVGWNWLEEKSEVGEVFVESREVGGKIGEVFEGDGEARLEGGDVGGLGSAMLQLHHGHHITTSHQHHPVCRIRQQEGVSWADGEDQRVEQGAEAIEVSVVCGQLPLEDAEGGVGGVDGVGSGVGDVGSRGDDVGVGGVESGSAVERV